MGKASISDRRYALLLVRSLSVLSLAAFAVLAAAQTSIPPNQARPFRDPALLQPPPGAKVAIIEYEDLECPFCAHAFPIVHAAAQKFHVPIEEYDLQIPSHTWSHQAAIFAHYLYAKISPQFSQEFRRELFATQSRIASPTDLLEFEQRFMQQHGKKMPAVVDPTGRFDREVKASTAQGIHLGVIETPTILVVTPHHWIEVRDVDKINEALEQAEADVASTPAHPAPHR